MTTVIRIAIHGAAGRMGRRLVALGAADSQLKVAAALESPGNLLLGEDAGIVAGPGPWACLWRLKLSCRSTWSLISRFPRRPPESWKPAGKASCRWCWPQPALNPGKSRRSVRPQARYRCSSPSMSMAVNLTMKLCELAGKVLADKDADVEILERHHRFKEDSPSGTALKFGEIIARQMGQTRQAHGRSGRPGKRPHGEIGYHAIRVGDNPGEHTIIFAMLGETLEMTVRASVATATPREPWPPPSSSPESRRDCMGWRMCWGYNFCNPLATASAHAPLRSSPSAAGTME